MNKLLYLPGLLFLLVTFFRVLLPILKTPAWKRLIDSARYERVKKRPEKSDRLLLKAVEKFPDQPAVYLEYYLNHSDSGDLKSRFEIIKKGWERTKDTTLSFFIGSAYLEEGELEAASRHLETEEVRDYIQRKHIFLLPLLYRDQNRLNEAEEEFWNFHGVKKTNEKGKTEALSTMSAQDIIPLALILKAQNRDWKKVMAHAPVKSVHSDMSWTDYREQLEESLDQLQEARTGITGSPERFNQKRKDFYRERLALIDEFMGAKP